MARTRPVKWGMAGFDPIRVRGRQQVEVEAVVVRELAQRRALGGARAIIASRPANGDRRRGSAPRGDG